MSNITIDYLEAVYEALRSNVSVEGGIHDLRAPEKIPFPYIVIGTFSTNNIRSFGSDLNDNSIAIHIFSRKRGKREILSIYEQIRLALHRVILTLSGTNLHIMGQIRLVDTLVEPDQNTMHGIVSYESITSG